MGVFLFFFPFKDSADFFRLYLYSGLGWWFGSLGNQSYVQNRFEKCFFLYVLYLFYFLFN